MTPLEFRQRMIDLDNGDPEAAHSAADSLLVAFILALPWKADERAHVAYALERYERMEKWYA